MKKFPVAIQIYSVRDDAQANLFGTLKKLKEMGYDGVEFAGLYGHTPEEVIKNVAMLGEDRKSTRLNSSHRSLSRMPSSA